MKILLDQMGMRRSLVRMAHEIIERNKGVDGLVLVGIRTRGAYLATRLANFIEQFEGQSVASAGMDISYWRDDHKKNRDGVIPPLEVDIQDKKVILVDDVLYSGRSVRAAMDGLMAYGRPKEIHLAVLIDRGHRQLPIKADYVGKNIPTSYDETIRVNVEEIDDLDQVAIESNQ